MGSGRGGGAGVGKGACAGAAPPLRAAQSLPSPPGAVASTSALPPPSPSQGGETALDYAKKNNHTEVVRLLQNPTAYLAAQVGRTAPHPRPMRVTASLAVASHRFRARSPYSSSPGAPCLQVSTWWPTRMICTHGYGIHDKYIHIYPYRYVCKYPCVQMRMHILRPIYMRGRSKGPSFFGYSRVCSPI